jgi:hypothetical protein
VQTDFVSVVIAWVNSLDLLAPVVDSLLKQDSRPPDEIIIATRHDVGTQDRLRCAYPGVTILSAPARTTIPALRSIGIAQARGTIVAVTEDHCVVDSKWVATIERRMHSGCAVVGGPVENGWAGGLSDWAAFLTDYAGFIPPADDGPVTQLPSNNVAYSREMLDGLCTVLDRGLWESFYYEQLVARGVPLISAPEMIVYHRRPFGIGYFIRQRYYYCRAFAGMRRQFLTKSGRVRYALGSVFLPGLLLLRGLLTLLQKRRFVRRYIQSLPLITVYVTAGAIGEMVGYVAGGGTSLEKVE